ncbi:MAG: ATP-binding protein [Thermoleophilaceae bacterium]
MPYVNCPRCGLRTYTAGGRFWLETCPSCGTRLIASGGRHELRKHAPTVSAKLDPDPKAPSAARHALDRLAPSLDAEALDLLQLLVSEVVTNSVKHGSLTRKDEIALDVYVEEESVYVEVHDTGVGFKPGLPDIDPERGSGWGLWLLEQMTSRWGIENHAGTTAWFEMRVS